MTRTQTLTRTCRTEGCTAPPDADHYTLHKTSTRGLLTAAYALTHTIERAKGKSYRDQLARADSRAKRDMITAEVIRRAGA